MKQGTLSQTVVRIVNEAVRGQEGNGDAGGGRTPQSEGKSRCHGHTPAYDFNHRQGDTLEPYILAERNRYTEHEQRVTA